MARIRSIKPAFWTDPKTNALSEHAALFFIGLWNFCDDSGYFDCSPRALSLLMPRFKSQAIQPILSRLEKDGLVVCSREAGVGLVLGWRHQKIDKPQASKHEGKTYQWDTPSDSSNGIERSSNVPRKDRIGEDRKGKDIIYVSSDDDTKVPLFDLEEVYREYPKRDGGMEKGKGMARLKRIVKTAEQFEEALKAVRGYKKYCVKKSYIKTEMVKMFSTFWDDKGDWKEWASAPASQASPSQESEDDFNRRAFGGT